jgi:hypothetical protein
MIKEHKRNGFLIVEQTTWYVYLSKEDQKNDKYQMMSSRKTEVWKATTKKIRKAIQTLEDMKKTI